MKMELSKQEQIFIKRVALKIVETGQTPGDAMKAVLDDDKEIFNKWCALGDEGALSFAHDLGQIVYNAAHVMRNLPVRKVSIENIEHPEWGTFGVWEDRDSYYEIGNSRGSRILDKWEAENFWKLHE